MLLLASALSPLAPLRAESRDVSSLSLDELLEVEVTTAGKVPETIRDTPASVHLVTRTDIEREGYRSLTDILENVPGVYNIYNYNGANGNFGIRGSWNARSQNSSVAILVNGIPQTRMDERSHPLDGINVPVEAIDRIEVIKGPNSVIYGNGASFGAINIITNESYFQNQAGVSYGSDGTQQASLRWSSHTPESHIIINAGVLSGDGPDFAYSELSGPHLSGLLSAYGIDETNDTLSGRLERESRYLQVAGDWKRLSFDYSHNETDQEFFSGLPPVADGSLRNTQTDRFTLRYRHAFDQKLSLDSYLSYNDYAIETTYDALFEGFVGNYTNSYSSWEFETLLNYEASERFRIVSGFNWQVMEDNYEYTNIPLLGVNNEAVILSDRETRSLFSQATLALNERWSLVAGIRVEDLRRFERLGFDNIETDPEPTFGGPQGDLQTLTPRASLIYQSSDDQIVKIMIGDALKMPTLPDSIHGPEDSRTFEVSYTKAAQSYLFEASAYHNELDEILIDQLRFNPDFSVETDTFIGNAIDITGVELILKNDLNDFWSTELSVNWQDAKETVDSERIEGDTRPVRPRQEVAYFPHLLAQAKINYRRENFSGALLGRFVDEMKAYYDPFTDERIGDDTPNYLVFDLNLRWDEIWEGLYCNVSIKNLFDQEIRYPSNPINTALLSRGTLGPERSLQISSGFKF